MKCPYCNTINAAEDNFCTNCGGYLQAAGDAATIAAGVGFSPHVSEQDDVILGENAPLNGISSETVVVPGTFPGRQLQNGRYVVDKILGQGGMGAAMLARDTRVSNKRVVIKELVSENADPAQREADVRNFEREVETLAHLDHPLIPTVTDSFQEGTRYYMVQEYVAGENLEDRLERLKGPIPEYDALLYASQVLTILDYLAHQQPPIVHRDIKPANIIIGSKDNLAHLVDFGIARAGEMKSAVRKQTSALGTPGYAPPEQYKGNADARSDIYALAATIHHLVTNRDPSDGTPFTYPDVTTINPQLSPDLGRILTRALTLDITQRYQSAAAMKYEIDEILQNCFGGLGNGDTSIYTRGYSGAPTTTRPRVAPTNQPPEPFPPSPEPWSHQSAAASYEIPRRQQQEMMFEYEQPRRQQQEMEGMEFERQSQQPFSIYRLFQPLYQGEGEQRYLLFSFIMLGVVIAIIFLIMLYLSGSGGII